MKTHTLKTPAYEFNFPRLDTLVRVEPAGDVVIIRATRDTFSERRKESFVHELAAEGFIDDDYRWYAPADLVATRRLSWVIDFSWLKIDPEITAVSRRFMFRLLGGAVLAWGALMAALPWLAGG